MNDVALPDCVEEKTVNSDYLLQFTKPLYLSIFYNTKPPFFQFISSKERGSDLQMCI